MFLLDESVGVVRVAFTDRHGGGVEGESAPLDLGSGGGRAQARLRDNVRRVASVFRVDPAGVVAMSQVHGSDVAILTEAPDSPPVADALVTRTPGLVLMVRAADCVPVLLADPVAGVVSAAHCGRRGLALGVVPAAVAAARAHGAGPGLRAWLGPRVCGSCYEVPAPMRAEVAAAEPAAWSTTSWQTPALDLAAGVVGQLTRAGVPVTDVADVVGADRACTVESDDLFSYRRQGARSGRLAGLVQVHP